MSGVADFCEIVTFAAIVNREIWEISRFVLWRFGQDGVMIPLCEYDTCILCKLESTPVGRFMCFVRLSFEPVKTVVGERLQKLSPASLFGIHLDPRVHA